MLLYIEPPLTPVHKSSAKRSHHIFGQPQPQDAVAANTHLLLPDDITINQGDSVTFVVNVGGHGIAIHPVNRRTTRQNIADDLCQGPQGTTEADRLARATVCNGTIVTSEIVDGLTVIGTQNLDYSITDGRDNRRLVMPAPPPRIQPVRS